MWALRYSLHVYIQEIVNLSSSAQAIPKQDVFCFNKILFEKDHSNELEFLCSRRLLLLNTKLS